MSQGKKSAAPAVPTRAQLEQARRSVRRLLPDLPPHSQEDRARLVALGLATGHKLRVD